MKKKPATKKYTGVIEKVEIGLSERQQAALSHFIGNTVSEGCRLSGIAKNTFYEWMKESDFKKALDDHRKRVFEEALGILIANTTKASCVLVDLLDNVDSPAIRRSVANDILDHVMKFKEMEEFEQRLAVLEKSLETKKAT